MSNVADKRCENGHLIDEAWDLCPYCPQKRADDIPVIRPNRPSRVDLEGSQSSRGSRYGARPATIEGGNVRPIVERTVAVPRIDPNEVLAKPRYVVGWLVGVGGNVRGESFPVRTGRNVIGRDRKSDIVIPDEQASSHHADLVYRPDERRFILMDHNSTNGTYVNEIEIEPRRDLANRDVVRIGTQKFMFVALCDETFSWEDQDA